MGKLNPSEEKTISQKTGIKTAELLLEKDSDYTYCEHLTKILDEYEGDFDDGLINKITLWKVNRFPRVPEAIITKINKIKKTDTCSDISRAQMENLVEKLLECPGVRIAMASTYLRFKNPSLFQIIDRRVYRVLYGEDLNQQISGSMYDSEKGRKEIVGIYFEYLECLKRKSKELKIEFAESDRILYNADKRMNGNLADKCKYQF
jgi:hypothetical protein